MYKSWKLRAAVAGVAMAAAPLLSMGGASAAGTAILTSVQPPNGPVGTTQVVVNGTGCGTPSTSTDTQTVNVITTGPGLPSGTGQVTKGMITGVVSGDFNATVMIPSTAIAGDVFTIIARCTGSVSGLGANSAPLTFTVLGSGGLTGAVTAAVTTAGVTSTSGATTAGATTAGTTGTTATTGVAQPITATPPYTG